MEERRNSAEGIKGEGKRGRNVGGRKGQVRREGEGKGREEGTFLMVLASFNIYIYISERLT